LEADTPSSPDAGCASSGETGWQAVYASLANAQTQIDVLNRFRSVERPRKAEVEKVSKLLSAIDSSGIPLDAVEDSLLLERSRSKEEMNEADIFCWQLVNKGNRGQTSVFCCFLNESKQVKLSKKIRLGKWNQLQK
jgi:hypothetical protein